MALTREQSLAQYGTEKYTAWNETEAQADWIAQGGGGVGVSGDLDPEMQEFADLIAQLTGSPIELPPLKVKDWEEYEKAALEELKPYYTRILKEEGGDVERAKKRMQEDYDRGLRIKREDYETAKKLYGDKLKPGETLPQYLARTRLQGKEGMFIEEGQELVEQMGKRGLFRSGIMTGEVGKLGTSQEKRQQAIDRALSRYEEESGLGFTRGMEDVKTAWGRRKFELGEEKKERAGIIGRQKRSDDIMLQEIERENLMRKAIQSHYG